MPPEDAARVVGVVLDDQGAIAKFVIEQEDHSLSEVSAGTSPVSADTMLAAEGTTINVGAGNIVVMDTIDDAGDGTITVLSDGRISLPSIGSFAFHFSVESSTTRDVSVLGSARLGNDNPYSKVQPGVPLLITYIHRAAAAGETVWLATSGAISYAQVLVRQIA